MKSILAGLLGGAVNSAETSAASSASALVEQYKPDLYFLAFLAVLVFLFYYVPRFRAPWDNAD